MKKILALTLVIAFVASCKKYPEGPSFSLRSKKARLANTWVIEAAFENDVDKTTDYLNTLKDYTLYINKSGTYSSSYSALGIVTVSESGSWTFSSDKKYVNFDPSSNSNANTVWTILKLKEDEFWAVNEHYTSSNIKQELHMKTK